MTAAVATTFASRESAQLYIEANDRECSLELKKLIKSRGSRHAVLKALTESGDGGVLVPYSLFSPLSNPIAGSLLQRVKRIPTVSPVNRVPRFLSPTSSEPTASTPVWYFDTVRTPTETLAVSMDVTTIFTPTVEILGEISLSLLEDTPDILAVLRDVLGRQLELAVEQMIIEGLPQGVTPDPAGGPWGLNESGVVPRVAAAGATLTYDDLLSLFWALPRQYHASSSWLFNNQTGLAISKLKDTAGMPLWTPGGLLFGKPVILSDAVDSIAAGKTPVWFGDMSSYTAMIRTDGAVLKVVDQPLYSQGKAYLSIRQRVGGRVTWADGLRGLDFA